MLNTARNRHCPSFFNTLSGVFARKARLEYPIPPAPRTAVLSGAFRSGGRVRAFPDGWSSEVERFAPQAIAAPAELLAKLAEIAEPTHAVIVLHREWEPLLAESARERLWLAYRVPVFEQIVAERGQLLAFECEAHQGLHIVSRRFAARDDEVVGVFPRMLRIGRDRRPEGPPRDVELCPCGRSGPRLVRRTEEPAYSARSDSTGSTAVARSAGR